MTWFCVMLASHPRMFDLSPFRTSSKASRNLIFCLPVHLYALEDDHNSLSLQFLLDRVVADLNGLSSAGIETSDGEVSQPH